MRILLIVLGGWFVLSCVLAALLGALARGLRRVSLGALTAEPKPAGAELEPGAGTAARIGWRLAFQRSIRPVALGSTTSAQKR